MKEKLTMLIVAIIVILVLSLAVMAMASTYVMTAPDIAQHGMEKAATQMNTDLSDVTSDDSRTNLIKDAQKADITR